MVRPICIFPIELLNHNFNKITVWQRKVSQWLVDWDIHGLKFVVIVIIIYIESIWATFYYLYIQFIPTI